jgi:hypothetical protein
MEVIASAYNDNDLLLQCSWMSCLATAGEEMWTHLALSRHIVALGRSRCMAMGVLHYGCREIGTRRVY